MASKSRPRSSAVVLLVDDHPLWRQTLRNLLLRAKAATRVVEASNGSEAIDVAQREGPGVIVMDIQMPDMNGVDSTRAIRERAPEAKVLVLSSSDDRTQVLHAVRAGASGYLVKSAEPAEIVDAVQRVGAGELVFPGELGSVVLSELRSPTSSGSSELDSLTAREADVLELMAQGLTNAAIADELSLSPKTVETHVASVFLKFGLVDSRDEHRRVAAVVRYLRLKDASGGT